MLFLYDPLLFLTGRRIILKRISSLFTICLISVIVVAVAGEVNSLGYADEIILVNKPLSAQDNRYEYPETLLKKIIEVTEEQYGKAHVQHTKWLMKRDRTLKTLIEGNKIHVMAEAPSRIGNRSLFLYEFLFVKGFNDLEHF